MEENKKYYNYFFRIKNSLFKLLLFGLAGIYMFYRANNNDEGMIVERFIELNKNQATIFYYALGVISIGVLILFLLSIYSFRGYLTVSEKEIVIPKIIYIGKEFKINFEEIREIEVKKIGGWKVIAVYVNRRQYSIFQMCLDSPKEFEELYDYIALKITEEA